LELHKSWFYEVNCKGCIFPYKFGYFEELVGSMAEMDPVIVEAGG
jgi:hypothetical protein